MLNLAKLCRLTILVGLLATTSACDLLFPEEKKEQCVASQQVYSGSFNTFASNGAPVARFSLQQQYTDYSPAGCNNGRGGPVTLTITSTAPVPLAFTYTLEGVGASGLVVWSYQGGVTRIAPGQTIQVGQVASSVVRVDVGARAVFTSLSQVP
jgi:hypothetical protein